MQCLGIDIGTDSARLYVPGKGPADEGSFYETPLVRTSNGRTHTMSAASLWESLMSMFAKDEKIYTDLQQSFKQTDSNKGHSSKLSRLSKSSNELSNELTDLSNDLADLSNEFTGDDNVRWGISVGATCSMVVMERVFEKGAYYFRSLDPGHEIIVWMDTRAQREAELATKILPHWALQQIGGKVTPEMGVAKLLWVDRYYGAQEKKVCVFELYDWVSYVFLSGGYHEGQVRCLEEDEPIFGPGKSAMDGSVKGWSAEILRSLGIKASVVAAPCLYAPTNKFPYVGTPLGSIGHFVVGHGCIDCYAPWAGLTHNETETETASITESRYKTECRSETAFKSMSNSGSRSEFESDSEFDSMSRLLMVAGTSTCFIASSKSCAPIKGFWGPFDHHSSQSVYTFGQPASGQLFGELFQVFQEIIPLDENPFEFIELHALALEQKHNAPLTVLARHYFYYGDKHGNRSPYGDFQMGEVYMDGVTCASENTFTCSLAEKSLQSLVLRYYLTMEFLVLQTAQLCSDLAATCGSIATVHLEGSQAQNRRFVQLLKGFVFPRARLFVRHDNSSKYSGCRGISAALAGKLGSNNCAVNPRPNPWCEVKPVLGMGSRSSSVQDVLGIKYQAFLQLAQWQASFRQKMKHFQNTN